TTPAARDLAAAAARSGRRGSSGRAACRAAAALVAAAFLVGARDRDAQEPCRADHRQAQGRPRGNGSFHRAAPTPHSATLLPVGFLTDRLSISLFQGVGTRKSAGRPLRAAPRVPFS